MNKWGIFSKTDDTKTDDTSNWKDSSSTDVMKIYQMLTPKPPELLAPGRKYIREGKVQIYNPNQKRKKHRYFFLFNDVLLLTKKEGEKKFWLKIYISLLTGLRVQDVLDSTNDPPDVEFRIYAPKKTIICFAYTNTEKMEWLTSIGEAIIEAEKMPQRKNWYSSQGSPTTHSIAPVHVTIVTANTANSQGQATMVSGHQSRNSSSNAVSSRGDGEPSADDSASDGGSSKEDMLEDISQSALTASAAVKKISPSQDNQQPAPPPANYAFILADDQSFGYGACTYASGLTSEEWKSFSGDDVSDDDG